MGWPTIWQSEIDPYCTALLAERFPGVPNLGDITTIDWSHVERPDIITGGFPCQDISYAGKGAGLAGARSGLWYEYARAIRELGPRYVIVENVSALLTRGMDAVLGTLADLGYDAEWSMYGASDLGAPHRRHRVWILAYANGESAQSVGRLGCVGATASGDTSAGRERQRVRDAADCCGTPLADAKRERSQGIIEGRTTAGPTDRPGDGRYPCGWTTEPNVGRVAHGLPEGLDCVFHPAEWEAEWEGVPRVAKGVVKRVDRLRGLGNAIVPNCALPIYRRILEMESP